jgi:hypothetical protein
LAAVATPQSQKSVGQDAAFEEGVEFVVHKLRQIGASGGLSLGDEGRSVLLHQTVKRGPLGAVTLVVDLGAIRCLPGLPTDGSHARLPRLDLGRSQGRATRLNFPVCRLPAYAYCGGATFGGFQYGHDLSREIVRPTGISRNSKAVTTRDPQRRKRQVLRGSFSKESLCHRSGRSGFQITRQP